ncbi:enoyl-CoA hydratase [Burkholderia ambifaria]|uniref:enoyl-CoA hydratase n=1 Tax=Burkholderia ambifaria TaxID=152480 RepID=UPI001B9CED7A|nr:enoyl-CoA hydratase [Burkholderia ambifaria]MBR8257225.1 enoyl-CoA hydratase [Burkholderia ambifaria]
MKDIISSVDSRVLTITLNRIEKKNSLTSEMYRLIGAVLNDAKSDPAIRVVVIRGTDSVFCAGNDVGELLSASADDDFPAFDFLRELHVFPKPVIAGVCGAAIGIGATILMHCDLIFAGDNARFIMPFVNLGICPEAASSMLLPRLTGYQRAAEILLTGAPFDAERALSIGLVNKIFPPSAVLPHVDTLARELARKPARALMETKRLMKMGDGSNVEQRMVDEFDTLVKLLKGGAAQEAIAAFQEKRAPDFSKF